MQSFRHFWLNVYAGHRFIWANTQTKTEIASIRKKQRRRNEMGYLKNTQICSQVNRFDARGQNVLGSSTIFQTSRFSTTPSELHICSTYTTTNSTPSCFSCWDESSHTQFCPKRPVSKFDLPPNLGSQVRSGQSWSCWISFDSGPQDKHFGTKFVRLPFGSKAMVRRGSSP